MRNSRLYFGMPMTKNRQRTRRFALTPSEVDARRKKCGQRIKELRKTEKLTLQEFARLIGYNSHSAVKDWEDEMRFPSQKALTALHEVFGVSPEWVLGLSDVKRAARPVTLPEGTVISDDQLEAALRVKTERAIEQRMRASDRTAKFMRHVRAMNSVSALMVPGPSVDHAVRLLVEFAENSAKRSWRDLAPHRIRRQLKKLGPDAAAVAELATLIMRAELEYESSDVFDDAQLKSRRRLAWRNYRDDVDAP